MRRNPQILVKEHFGLVCVVVIALLVYARLLWFGPISWDDPEMVFMNRDVKDFSVTGFFHNYYVGNYIPVTMLFHAVSYRIFGSAYGGHHALNIMLHLLNGVLIYSLGRKIFHSKTIALTGALIFLLHPLQVESVAWIAELKNIVSTGFFLGALIMFCLFSRSEKPAHYAIMLLLFVMACLSKPSAVIFPLCVVSVQFMMQRKLTLKNIPSLIPILIISVIFGVINLKAQSSAQFINYSHQFPFYQKIPLAGVALAKYFQFFILPVRLSTLYPYPAITVVNLLAGYIFVCVIGGLIFYLLKKKKLRTAGIILFILSNLLLVLQFIPFGEVLYADRYCYVPVAGFAWLLGVAIEKYRISPKSVLAVLGVLFAAASFARLNSWKDGITLYEDIIAKYPAQFVALNSAGVESMRMNNDQKAADYFMQAMKVAPRNYKGFYNAGLLSLKMKKPEQAISFFNESLNLHEYSKAYVGRANAWLLLGNNDNALADARKAISTDNTNANGFFVLGNILNDKRQLQEALAAYDHALALNGEQPDYYFRRAIVHGKLNNFPSSLSDLEKCTALDPYYIEAYYWKGVAKVNLSQNPCDDFKVAARNNYEPAINAFKKYCR